MGQFRAAKSTTNAVILRLQTRAGSLARPQFTASGRAVKIRAAACVLNDP
jgi:hypothetical protein